MIDEGTIELQQTVVFDPQEPRPTLIAVVGLGIAVWMAE